MNRIGYATLINLCLQAALLPWALAAEPARKYPAHVSGYELATHDDLLYRHLLDRLIVGEDPKEWPVLRGLGAQVGEWINPYIQAERIATVITEGMPIEDQRALKHEDELVADCAKVLGLPKPLCFVRNHPETAAYVTELDGRPVLVLTSSLLKLFKGRPEELRFIVGRELGHIKCDHVRMRLAATGIVGALRLVDVTAIPDQYQAVLPTLTMGRLCSWLREAEISADRAGMLCCQDPDVAYQALLWMLHGLDAENIGKPELDALLVVRQFERWQDRPFVEFLTKAKASTLPAPFIPERISALKDWADTKAWQSILARTKGADPGRLIVIEHIGIEGLASKDQPRNPYIVAYVGSQKIFTTAAASKVVKAKWKDISVAHSCIDWQPIFFEVWDDCYGRDELMAGFVLYPEPGRQQYHARLMWDWKDRTSITRAGLAEIEVDFRIKDK
jgi:Zn-dependent protease with chaperone function